MTSSNNATDYLCRNGNEIDLSCAETCIGLADCEACQCAVPNEGGGPWGSVGDVFFCGLPIIFLIVVTVKPKPWKTTLSLPVAAVLMYIIRLMYLGLDPLLTSACLVLGVHEAWTPLSIMAGAITLFQTMEATHCMHYMMREIKELTKGHVVAAAMLVYCFCYMIEGAGGFGTPLALGPPMLVSMGHEPFRAIVMMLSWYNFPTIWGAAGAPLWFGFGNLGLSDEDLIVITYKAQTCMTIASFFMIPFILTVSMPFEVVRANIFFILLAIAGVMGPALGLSFVSYEFPSLVGGLIGCIFCAVLTTFRVGLSNVSRLHPKTTETSEDNSITNDSNTDHLAARNEKEGSSERSENPRKNCDGDVLPLDFESGELTRDNPSENENTKLNDSSIFDKDVEANKEVVAHNNKEIDAYTVSSECEKARKESKKKDDDSKVDDTAEFQLIPRRSWNNGYLKDTLSRTFPIWGIVLILILTRVNQIGLKKYLTLTEPYLELKLGTYGDFHLSPSLVFMLNNILTYPSLNWKFPALYIPFFFPFILISLCTMFIYRKEMTVTPLNIFKTVADRMRNPTIALMGALTLVQLIIQGGESAPSYILGETLAMWLKGGFVAISAILGALGTFFCGSGAVSNLTLGSVQKVAASSIGISETSMLALQAVGAAAGNSISIGNIISSCAVIGLVVGEGKIFLRTARFAFSLTTIATIVMLIFFIRF